MFNMKEIEMKLREARDKAYDESETVSDAFIATKCNDKELQVKDAIATETFLALNEALTLIETITWNSDDTADEVVSKIVDRITFEVTYVVNKMYSADNKGDAQEQVA